MYQGKTTSKVPNNSSLAERKGDSVTYLTESLYERKDYYIGKKVKVFLKDIELEIKDYNTGYDPGDKTIVPSITLKFKEDNKLSTSDNYNNKPLRTFIYFEIPAPSKEANFLGDKNDYKWTKDEYKFYKNFIIKDIEIPKYGAFRKYFEQ